MSKLALVKVFNGMFEHCSNWDCKIIAVTGDKLHCLEIGIKLTQLKGTLVMRHKVGDRPILLGASLQWDEKGEEIVSFSSDFPAAEGEW